MIESERTYLLHSKRRAPNAYRQELRWLYRNAMPIVLSYLLQNSLQSINVISAGHLGATELASASLASMFVTVTGISVATGSTLALDTLCSQAFTSAKDKKIVGLHVQRCLAFLSVLFIPILVVWWYAEYVFLLLRQDPQVARLAGSFVRWMIPSAPAFAIFEALKKMLQAQGIFRAPTLALLLGAPINMVLSYVLVWSPLLGFGFIGAPIASCLTYWLIVLYTAFYIYRIDGYEVWPTWSTQKAFDWRSWGPMVKLAVPGILLICSETWAYEIIALGASWIDTTSLSVQSVILTSTAALYPLSFGVGIASSNRVGNLLGAQKPHQARIAAKTAIGVALSVATFNSGILFLFRHRWAYMFTKDENVVSTVAQLLPLVSLFVFADNLAGTADGVLNGQGRQHVGAWLSLVTYYVSALPIGFYLCFHRGWGLTGLWAGLVGSLMTTSFITVLLVWFSDWHKEARKAEIRVHGEVSIKFLESEEAH
ncbi:mate-domain-containing protein [Spinellus fusiger]|nr:mate-domain-containing protein [Spinellus fusiger]